jgi:hypothetical protein
MRRNTLIGIAVVCLTLAVTAVAAAGTITASLSGGASAGPDGVRLTSDLTNASSTDDTSAITFSLPAGVTFADLKTLGTAFEPLVGSAPSGASTPVGCGGGSPRFSVTLASGKSVFVYLGPAPSFDACTLGAWQSSGNLIGNDDTGRYDTSQIQAGTQSNTYSGALALVGTQQVKSISLVVDAGWAFTPKVQTVLVRDVRIDGQTFFAGQSTKGSSPAQLCKAELAAIGRTAFEQKYGKNHNLRNAMGKCVSGNAHAQHAHHGRH